MTDLDVDGLLGTLLLVEDAALGVAEEAPAGGRRRGGSGVAEARREGGQHGSHRHGSAWVRSDSRAPSWGWVRWIGFGTGMVAAAPAGYKRASKVDGDSLESVRSQRSGRTNSFL